MEWSERQILETLRLIEASDYDEVRLEADNFKLHVRKSGAPTARAEVQAPPSTPPERAPVEHARPSAAVTPAQPAAVPAADAVFTVPEGMVAIRAPLVGTFYSAPAPHLPPFVEPGASVKAEDTVCLIEVMKLFNTIKAGVAGKVVKVLARNAATVKKDQVLIVIEPPR